MVNEDYVITGGPCSGKSTIITALHQRGFVVVPESAREVLRVGSANPLVDNYEFQRHVLEQQKVFERLNPGSPRFLDRSLHDSIGYCKFWGNEIPPDVMKAISRRKYAKVFFLEPVGDYTKDAQRKETPEQAIQIAKCVEEGYISAEFTPIKVQAFSESRRTSIKKRLEFILDHVGNGTQI